MPEHRYCLNQDILSVQTLDLDHKEFCYVPAGSVVSVENTDGSEALVKVDWNSKTILMFLQDIYERAEPLN